MTPADITAWRNRLPMSDLGMSAKKVYHAISDCNKVKLDPKERFDVLELLRPLIQFICQSLSKHYINQTSSLTKQQLTIANLAQTLQLEMASGYKLLVEQLAAQGSHELKTSILPIALSRINHYFTHVFLRSYHLYTFVPTNGWHELYLIYQFAEKNQFLKQNNLDLEFKRTLLLAASSPYQWRQSEQEAIYKATESWAGLATLQDHLPKTSTPGFLIIDFSKDKPPASLSRVSIEFSNACRALDVNPILERLKILLADIEPNELKARIAHSNEPEYTVSTTVLRGLIKEWTTPIVRKHERKPSTGSIQICIGLASTHYYLNGEQPFQSQQGSSESDLSMSLPTLGLQEDSSFETTKLSIDTEKTAMYPLYTCTLADENPNGYGLTWPGEVSPPMQAGEIIGIVKQNNPAEPRVFEVGAVRWLKQKENGEYSFGIDCLAKTAQAAGVQLIKEGQPAGYFLRCLIFDSNIVTPTLPFKSGSQVSITQKDMPNLQELELTELIDSTGSFKRFEFIKKQSAVDNALPPTSESTAQPTKEEKPKKTDGDSSFDSIWSDL